MWLCVLDELRELPAWPHEEKAERGTWPIFYGCSHNCGSGNPFEPRFGLWAEIMQLFQAGPGDARAENPDLRGGMPGRKDNAETGTRGDGLVSLGGLRRSTDLLDVPLAVCTDQNLPA